MKDYNALQNNDNDIRILCNTSNIANLILYHNYIYELHRRRSILHRIAQRIQ